MTRGEEVPEKLEGVRTKKEKSYLCPDTEENQRTGTEDESDGVLRDTRGEGRASEKSTSVFIDNATTVLVTFLRQKNKRQLQDPSALCRMRQPTLS